MATNREDVLDLTSGDPYAFSAQVIGVENEQTAFMRAIRWASV